MDMINGPDTATAEVNTAATATDETAAPSGRKRGRPRKSPIPEKRSNTPSSIGFPYRDLESAVSVATAYIKAGGVALTSDQLGWRYGSASR
jgi:hypothetical protein